LPARDADFPIGKTIAPGAPPQNALGNEPVIETLELSVGSKG
jgi:hypothetical protein